MQTFSLRSVLILFMFIALLFSHFRARLELQWKLDGLIASFAGDSLANQSDVQIAVDNAAGAELSIIFVHVDWAIMQLCHKPYATLMLDWRRLHANDPIMFHYVDCTSGYAPLYSLPGWFEHSGSCLLYTSPSPRDKRQSRMPSSA